MCYTCGRNIQSAYMRVTKTSGVQKELADFRKLLSSLVRGELLVPVPKLRAKGCHNPQLHPRAKKPVHGTCVCWAMLCNVIHLQQLHNLECENRHFQTSLLYMFLIYGKEKTTQTILNSLIFLDNQVFLSRFNLNSTPVCHYSSFFMTFLLKPKDSSFPSIISASELQAFFSTQ